jgi:hypothetical protein
MNKSITELNLIYQCKMQQLKDVQNSLKRLLRP